MKLRLVTASGWATVIAITLGSAAAAPQPGTPPASVAPSTTASSVNPESAFSGYQPFGEEKLRSWKEANQEVADHPGMGSMGSMGNMGSIVNMGSMGSMGNMGNMPGMESKDHGKMAMTNPATMPGRSDSAHTEAISGTGVVQGVDKAGAKVKLTHDPIASLGWPRMSMFFRLKDSSLADRVKEGDKVEFSLEKAASGYIVSDLKKRTDSR